MLDLTVCVPTCARETLAATLASIPDGIKVDLRYSDDGLLGHPQRNIATAEATTEWIAYMDDDDTYAPDAFEIIEANLTDKRVPHIFQMEFVNHEGWPKGHILWAEPELRWANVGTPMFVVPNIPGKLGTWLPQRSGDWAFIEETCRLQGDPVWVPETIALIRPA